jgi:hypothetical protein
MGDDGTFGKKISEIFGDVDEPFLTTAISLGERGGVLPVDVHSIQLVIDHKLGKFLGTFLGAIP